MVRLFQGLVAVGLLGAPITSCGLSDGGGCLAADCGGDIGPPGSGGTPSHAGSGNAGHPGVAAHGGTGNETGGTGATVGGTGATVGGTGGSTGGTQASVGGTAGTTGTTGGSAGTKGGTTGGSESGGSGGNAGAGGASEADDRCDNPGDCELVTATCCGACSPSTSDFVALNHDGVKDYVSSRSCTDVACAPCPSTTSGWFGATCDAGRCKVFDLRETDLTACDTSDDCTLRAGLECCEQCVPTSAATVALNKSADLASLVCAPITGCVACEPTFPEGLAAACVTGRCQTMLPTR